MHGHISYVTRKLGEFSHGPLTEDMAARLRSMRTMLISGLESASDHHERSRRLSLVRSIDGHLQNGWRNAT